MIAVPHTNGTRTEYPEWVIVRQGCRDTVALNRICPLCGRSKKPGRSRIQKPPANRIARDKTVCPMCLSG